MILFKKIRWKNFLSTGNSWTELNLNEYNTTLIVGKNGAGKSTLLDALSFVLFGKAFRKINKPQLVNSITDKNLIVEIEFNIGSNDYKIVRGMKPNLFEIYKNKELIDQSAEMVDYQEYLEKHILKCEHKTFCQMVILGTATFQPFMQLTTAQRREVIEDILNLQVFTNMNVILKEQMVELNERYVQNNLERQIADEALKLTKEHIDEMQQSSQQLIEEMRSRITETDSQIAALDIRINEHNIIIKDIEKKLEKGVSLSKKLGEATTLEKQLRDKIVSIDKEIKFFENHDNCPTCKQTIDAGFKAEIISPKDIEIHKLGDAVSKLVVQIAKYRADLEKLEKLHLEKQEESQNRAVLMSERNGLIRYKDKINKDIENASTKIEDDSSSKLEKLEKAVDKAYDEYNALLEEKLILGAASSLLKDGGIKARIIKQYIPIINNLINKYLSSMEFMCQFELDEQFNEKLKSRYRDEFSYTSFSEGEKMRINLAILFTWRAIAKLRNSVNTNILIMDEVFDSSLDSEGTEEFIRLLNNLTNETNTFIISHKTDQLVDKFEKVIRFNKVKNFSKVL